MTNEDGKLTTQYACVQCKKATLQRKKNYLVCDNCGNSFIISNDSIIIFKSDYKLINYLVTTFLEYKKIIAYYKEIIASLRSSQISKYRLLDIEKFEKKINKNINYFRDLKERISSELDIESVFDYTFSEVDNMKSSYLTNFDYLKRDWGTDDIDRNEISTILNYVRDYNNPNLNRVKKDNCLVLGAGAGRLMYEISKDFESTYGIDNSYTMVSLFYDLNQKDINFSILNFKNVIKTSDIIKSYEAKKINSLKRIKYCVADVQNLPYVDNFFSVITSIYFTDVVELPLYIREVYRVLKPQGLFIHFGPLQYHFENPIYMFSAEEVKVFFKNNGFKILDESFVETNHKVHESLMQKKSYNNWFFIAKKDEIDLSEETVLALEYGTQLIEKNTYSQEMWESESLLKSSNGEIYEGAKLINLFIKKVNGTLTILEILRQIEREIECELNIREFIDKLDFLIKNRILKIKSYDEF